MNKLTKVTITLISTLLYISSTGAAKELSKNALPEIGVVASEILTLDKEEFIGDAIMRQMRGKAPIIQDPVLNEYLEDIGNRLVTNADNVKFPFEFFWINNKAINAFAFYGGHVGVHTGLMHNARTESELASVLAHEIAHVTQRHLARKSLAQKRASPLQIASLIGSVFLVLADPEAGIAAMNASQAAAIQSQIDYTRGNEHEADRIGIATLSRSGFDPNGAANFFGILAAEYRLVSKPPARLLTHPLTETRISDARARATNLPQVSVPPSLQFHLAKARVLARYTLEEKYAVDYFQAKVNKNTYAFKEAAQYGLAMALLRTDKPLQAKAIINQLLAKDPSNRFYLDVVSDIHLKLGDARAAILALKKQFDLTPHNEVLAMNLANAYLAGKQYDNASLVLRDYLLVHPKNEIAYQLLIKTYQESRQLKEMHQTKAELLALYGAYPSAIDELQFAYNFSGENYLIKQKIRARIKQFREEENRLKAL